MVAMDSGADNGFFYAGQVMHFSSPFTVFLIYHKHSKGEILAKRCAMYLYREQAESNNNYKDLKNCYENLGKIYQKRNCFVHEGLFSGITDEYILILRKCVRESLLKILSDQKSKEERITSIRNMVKRYWHNVENTI